MLGHNHSVNSATHQKVTFDPHATRVHRGHQIIEDAEHFGMILEVGGRAVKLHEV